MRHPILERNELVVSPGQHHLVSPRRLQEAGRQLHGRERDLLLVGAGHADGAGVDAAVAGIEHYRAPRGLRLRGRGLGKGSRPPDRDRRGCRDPPDPSEDATPADPAVCRTHDLVAPAMPRLDSSMLPWSMHGLHENNAISHCKIKKLIFHPLTIGVCRDPSLKQATDLAGFFCADVRRPAPRMTDHTAPTSPNAVP